MLGILLICFAIDLGAPFCSDMLSRFINLRSPGNPPSVRRVGFQRVVANKRIELRIPKCRETERRFPS